MKIINLKDKKGITLITLVITIIVLMILAGVTVTALTGERSTIKEAKGAASSAEQQSVKEKVQAAVLGSIKKNGDIDKDILNNKLGTSITSFPADVNIDGIQIVIKEDGKVYLGSEDIPYTTSEMLSKGAIKVGDYVDYNVNNYTQGWKVFSIDQENGNIEIISNQSVKNLSLKGKDGYNKAVGELNKIANEYIDKKYVIKARALGTNPNNIEGNTNVEVYSINDSNIFTSVKMITRDNNYIHDYNIINANTSLQCSTECWYASRDTKQSNITASVVLNSFFVYYGSDNNIKTKELASISRQTLSESGEQKGVRPILTLKGNVEIENQGGIWVLK